MITRLIDLGNVRSTCVPSEGVDALLVDFASVSPLDIEAALGKGYPALIGGIFFLEGTHVGVEVYNDPERLWGDWERLLMQSG